MPHKLFKPLTDLPSRAGRKLADVIDNPQGEGGRLRGFLAGASEGAGDVLSDMTSPFSIGMQLMGAGGLKRLASLAKLRNAPRGSRVIDEGADLAGRLGPEFAPVGGEAAVNTSRAARVSEEARRLSEISRRGSPQPGIGAQYIDALIENSLSRPSNVPLRARQPLLRR